MRPDRRSLREGYERCSLDNIDKGKHTLLDVAERIGEGAARDCTAEANTGAERLQARTVNTMGDLPESSAAS